MHAWEGASRRAIGGINEQKQPQIAFRRPLTHYLSQLRAGTRWQMLYNEVGAVHILTVLSYQA